MVRCQVALKQAATCSLVSGKACWHLKQKHVLLLLLTYGGTYSMCALQAWKSASERLEVSVALYMAEGSMKGMGEIS